METALLSLAIFSLRLVDVSIGTLRIVMLVRGRRWTAGGLGFFESLTWVLAAGLVLTNLDSPYKIVAFAAGYATGTVLGSTIERHLALGHTILRIVTAADQPSPAHRLRERGFGVTEVNGSGMNGEVRIAFSVVSRQGHPCGATRTSTRSAPMPTSRSRTPRRPTSAPAAAESGRETPASQPSGLTEVT